MAKTYINIFNNEVNALSFYKLLVNGLQFFKCHASYIKGFSSDISTINKHFSTNDGDARALLSSKSILHLNQINKITTYYYCLKNYKLSGTSTKDEAKMTPIFCFNYLRFVEVTLVGMKFQCKD